MKSETNTILNNVAQNKCNVCQEISSFFTARVEKELKDGEFYTSITAINNREKNLLQIFDSHTDMI